MSAAPAGIRTLSQAKRAKQDEFYTQMSDIANELRHYRKHLEGKIVLGNGESQTEGRTPPRTGWPTLAPGRRPGVDGALHAPHPGGAPETSPPLRSLQDRTNRRTTRPRVFDHGAMISDPSGIMR